MHVDVVPRRDDTACGDKQYFWVCHSGKFRGCCTEDPCGLGYCLDGKEEYLSSKHAASTSSIKFRTASSTLTSSNDDDGGTITETETETETEEERPTKTMTDSGTTHTIPNNDRVTVTKHTLIVTDKAPSRTPTPTVSSSSVLDSTGVPSSGATRVVPSETASASGGSPEDNAGSSFSTGAIAGAAIGGVIALAIIAILIVVFHRRRRHARRYSQDSMNNIGENGSGEKAYFEAMSPHTTGTQGSGDPFAPFGGQNHSLLPFQRLLMSFQVELTRQTMSTSRQAIPLRWMEPAAHQLNCLLRSMARLIRASNRHHNRQTRSFGSTASSRAALLTLVPISMLQQQTVVTTLTSIIGTSTAVWGQSARQIRYQRDLILMSIFWSCA